MQKSTLGFFERKRLERAGKRDAENNAFGVGKSIVSYVDTDVTLSAEEMDSVSTFMCNEVQHYVCERDMYFKKTRCIYKVPSESKKGRKNRKKRKKIEKALVDIDVKICNCREAIEKARRECVVELKALAEKQKAQGKFGQKEEIVAFYENKKTETIKRYNMIIRMKEVDIFSLIDEKIRIIELTRFNLSARYNRHVLRIHTYYKAARTRDEDLPVACITGEKLMAIRGQTVLGEYDKTLDVLKNDRAAAMAKKGATI